MRPRNQPTTSPDDLLTLDQCAATLSVCLTTITGFCRAGHLAYSVPAEVRPRNNRIGPQSYRVRRGDWEAFIASRMRVGVPEEPGGDRPVS